MTAKLSALDRLKKAANFTPSKRVVKLNDGTEFEMYVTPLTMSERERAQKMPGGDDANGFGLNLLVNKAMDENGQRLFQAGQIAEMREEVRDDDIQKLILGVIQEDVQSHMNSAQG